MTDRLVAKTERYERMLAEALEGSAITEDDPELADAHLTMAEAYLSDGRHFLEDDDYVTALASFSYGHGWLDAGIRAGFIDDDDSVEGARGV